MKKTISFRKFAAGATLALITATGWAAAPTPTPFTAKYQVLQGGETIGEATVSLSAAGNGEWTYQNNSQGTGGVAAMLGASSSESTRFRWNNGTPETVSYDYKMQALKAKQRHLTVAPGSHQVSVEDGKGSRQYAGTAGMVDRNTLPYALGLALRAGKTSVMLPVAVKQRVENQQFKLAGKEQVKVPAGSFDADKVSRTDDTSFSAWYVPAKYPLPVKFAQTDGGNLTLELVSYSAQ